MKKTLCLLMWLSVLLVQPISYAATNSGTVVDEKTGDPLEMARVTLALVEGDGLSTWMGAKRADEYGNFSFQSIAAGDYSILTRLERTHLPEYYDDIPEINRDNRTLIPVEEGWDVVLNLIELKQRPFYFESVRFEPRDILEEGGRGKIIAEVVNTQSKKEKMRFLVMLQVTRRDATVFHGSSSTFPVSTMRKRFTLKPGISEVEIPVLIPKHREDKSIITVTISGGNAYWKPMLPEYRGKYLVAYPIAVTPILPQPIDLQPIYPIDVILPQPIGPAPAGRIDVIKPQPVDPPHGFWMHSSGSR